MSDKHWFGYQPIPGAIMAWGARAIFKPHVTSYPLDFLPDRQGGDYKAEDFPAFKAFCGYLNKAVIPELQKKSKFFGSSDGDKFVMHFDWPDDPTKKIVAEGSPNASCGYFYLAVNLMTVEQAAAHPEVKPPREIAEEERAKRSAEIAAENERTAPLVAADRKQRNEKKKTAAANVEAKAEGKAEKKSGEKLEVNDRLAVEANQSLRTAFVLAVLDDEALIEYHMPGGKTFLRVIHATMHGEIRSVSPKSIPKKWAAAMETAGTKPTSS
jgi:hypothetical protein